MHTTSPLNHAALLTLARKLDAALSDGDRDRVVTASRTLLDALVDHIRAEQPEMAALSSDARGELARGQQRLMDHAGELARAARSDDPSGGGLAPLLIAELTVQADDERLHGLVDAGS
jgi:hypothetical protein